MRNQGGQLEEERASGRREEEDRVAKRGCAGEEMTRGGRREGEGRKSGHKEEPRRTTNEETAKHICEIEKKSLKLGRRVEADRREGGQRGGR